MNLKFTNILAVIYCLVILITICIIVTHNFVELTDNWLQTNELGDLLAGIFAPLAFLYLVKGQKDLEKASEEQSKEIKRQRETQELNEKYKSWEICQKLLKDLSFVIAEKYCWLFKYNAFSEFRGKKLSNRIGQSIVTNPEGHRIVEILISDIVEHMITKNTIGSLQERVQSVESMEDVRFNSEFQYCETIEKANNKVNFLKNDLNRLTFLYENYINTLENFMNNLESENQRHQNLNNSIKGGIEYMFYEAIKGHLEYIKNEIATAPLGASQ